MFRNITSLDQVLLDFGSYTRSLRKASVSDEEGNTLAGISIEDGLEGDNGLSRFRAAEISCSPSNCFRFRRGRIITQEM